MRRLILIFSAVFVAAGFISFTTLTAKAEPAEQFQSSDGAPAPENTTTESQPDAGFISQGSVVDTNSAAVIAARADVAEEERLPDYSQVVDNSTTRGSFSARGWEEQQGDQGTGVGQVSYGGGYVYTGSDSGVGQARFKVRIPTSNDYTVYAWWPASSSNSDGARFGIGTASGTQWTSVDQTRDGGIWIKLGTYAMEKGERFIQVSPPDSPSAGNVVADAVAVVRGDVTMPPDEQAAGGTTSRSADGTYSTSSLRNPTGRDVVRVAKRWIGTRYRWGTCTRRRMSCTCETKRTYRSFGHKLPMTERGQWKYNRSKRIWRKSNLKFGDHVFFKENGRRGGITHVGIYSGNGNIVHASSYFGKVTESKMKYIRGYFGAKRYRLH